MHSKLFNNINIDFSIYLKTEYRLQHNTTVFNMIKLQN